MEYLELKIDVGRTYDWITIVLCLTLLTIIQRRPSSTSSTNQMILSSESPCQAQSYTTIICAPLPTTLIGSQDISESLIYLRLSLAAQFMIENYEETV